MQFDLLQNDLFSTDEPEASPSKKTALTAKKPAQAGLDTVLAKLPALPDSLLSALSAPPETEFHDIDPEGYELGDDEIASNQKSPNAFKTISEASALLDVPQHVLRFWESRFSQIKPIKSRGGRRYYRSEDMKILETIKHLLYKQGYTIKGAKKAFVELKKAEMPGHAVSAGGRNSLSLDHVFAQIPSRETLSHKQIAQLTSLRSELVSLRDTLKMHM